MAESQWVLWELTDVVFTLERSDQATDDGCNLITRAIPAKQREARKLVTIALQRVTSNGVVDSLKKGRIKPFKSADYPLYELVISRRLLWRMFVVKHGGNAYLVIIDVFESHKGDGRRVNQLARRCKDGYDVAVLLAKEKFGGS